MVYLKLLLTAVFWGGTFIAGRMLAGSVAPFSAAFFRFLIAVCCLHAILLHRQGKTALLPNGGRQLMAAVLLGMTGVFAYNAFFFYGLKLVPASRASVIIANNPIVISLLSAIFFGEELSPVRILGILLSVSGAVIAISGGAPLSLFTGGVGMGDMLILGCVFSWSAYSLLGKRVMGQLSPLVATTHATTAGMLLLFIPAWLSGMPADVPSYSLQDWGALAYLGVFGTVLGFVWYYDGIRAIGASRASLFINFVPISAIGLAHVILGEPLTSSLVVGGTLVVSGVTLNHLPAAGRLPVGRNLRR